MSWILLTNDDGIDATSLQILVDRLHERGHKLIVFAPSENNSAVSMKISLGIPLTVVNRKDPRENVHQYEIGGTPCDCVIAALDGGIKMLEPNLMPTLCISGVNQGPNMSIDIMHSGTVSAARESALYGLPSIAVSLATYEHSNFDYSVKGAIEVMQSCLDFLPCLLYTSPSPRDQRGSRMPSSA